MATLMEERRDAVLAFYSSAVIAHSGGGLAVLVGGTPLSRTYPLGTAADLLWMSAYNAVLRQTLAALMSARAERRRA